MFSRRIVSGRIDTTEKWRWERERERASVSSFHVIKGWRERESVSKAVKRRREKKREERRRKRKRREESNSNAGSCISFPPPFSEHPV